MATELKSQTLTAEQFMAGNWGEGIVELVRGEVVHVSPPRPEHGLFRGNIVGILWDYGRRSGLGYALSNDSSILTERDPDTVRGPDVCFYTDARWPRSQVGRGLPPVAPDLVVEVVSPGNRPGAMLQKVGEYLDAGVLLVWIVDPKSRTLTMYRPADAAPVVLREDQAVGDLPELPGFRCAVADIFR